MTKIPSPTHIASATRRFEFCAGHRLMHHNGKCRHLHGHNYVADITVRGKVGADGMVMDFGDLKRIVGGWIDEHFDHATLLNVADPIVGLLQPLPEANVHVMTDHPTAEVLARKLLWIVNILLERNDYADVKCVRVHLQETANCAVVVEEP